jgi:glutamate-ammonia-ligase adenylyltransferase
MPQSNIKDLLLAPRLDPQEVSARLSPYGIKDPVKADANLQAMADDPQARQLLAEILEELLTCVAQSANPDQALNHFERFARAAVNQTRLFSYFNESPRTLEILAKTFGGSQYMAEILIRDPIYLYWATDPSILDEPRKRSAIARELWRALKPIVTEEKRLDYLRAFKRKETLHIGIRDLLRLCSVEDTLAALSNLAEVLISAAYRVCQSSLRKEYGLTGREFGNFTILGLGKLGGGELNFSSDVDLIYLYASDQEEVTIERSPGEPEVVSASDYYRKLSQRITVALSESTTEGYLFRVDLRLRPEGSLGNIAYALDAFQRYYATRGQTWERFALLKAWPAAGRRRLGRQFLDLVSPFIYQKPFDLQALNDIRKMKQQINRKMAIKHQRLRNVKLGFGGIREIELIVQALQVSFGHQFPEIRHRRTLSALGSLHQRSLISDQERETLSEAYLFLRDVENKLQMVNDAQTHSIPTDAGELESCARMLGYLDQSASSSAEQFLRDHRLITGRVNEIYEQIFGETHSQRFHQSP